MTRRRSAITIRDVALAAGVSVSTVSRVLNDKEDVAQETYSRVQQTIDQLGYTSSLAAKSMRSRRTNVIGLVVPDLRTSFTIQAVRGINLAIEKFSYDLIIYTSGNVWDGRRISQEQQHVALLNGSLADGTIVVTPAATTFPTDHPLVFVDPHSGESDVPAVIATNRVGAMTAVDYLLSLGHRRIGFIGGRSDLVSALRRLQGYRDRLAEAGLPFEPELVQIGDYTRPTAYLCAQRLLRLSQPPTAIFASNDESAIGVIEAAVEKGMRVPQDLSVIGFDNIPEAAQVSPRLTTIDQGIETMGYLAVEMLVDLLQGRSLESNTRKVPTRLIVRESCRAV